MNDISDDPSIPRPPPEPSDDDFDLEPERVKTPYLTLDYPPMIEVILCWIFVWFSRSSYPLIDFSLGKSISF
nr:hypothetical protein [Tanacetum cinerariifolium]